MIKNTYTAGALFAGIGGFCFGFEKQGFKTAWANDFDNQVAKTYEHNFPDTKFIHQDICELDFNNLEPVDVLHAGFPCQSFSQAGNRLGFDDPRGQLFNVMMDKIIEANWKPKVLLFENSTHLKSGSNGDWFRHIKYRIKKAGFWFDDQNAVVVSTHEHAGLPQKRERLFLFATLKSFFDFNPFGELPITSEKIKNTDILDLKSKHDDSYYLSDNNRYGKWILSEGKKMQPGQLIQLRQHILRPQQENVCPTLTANMGLGGHNVPFLVQKGKLRKMTERECLRMQGFPEHFEFPELAKNAKYRMIGNSVSPAVSEKLATAIYEELNSENEFKARSA